MSDFIIQNENSHSLHRKSLLTTESFNRLTKFQEAIFENIEMTPSFRKIINLLITDENLKVLSQQLLKNSNECL